MDNAPNFSELLSALFPELDAERAARLAALEPLYREWNARINVVSRKDIDNLMIHHVLHSLAIARFVRFAPGTRLLDVGTGGGFPGIPLAVLFPDCRFTLIDRIGKKTKVAAAVAEGIGLKNVEVLHENVTEERRRFDFVISRAVMRADELYALVAKRIDAKGKASSMPNGMLCLKGGDLTEETQGLKNIQEFSLADHIAHPFFETKKLLYVPAATNLPR